MAYDNTRTRSSSRESSRSEDGNSTPQQYGTAEASPHSPRSPVSGKGESTAVEQDEGSPLLTPERDPPGYRSRASEDSVLALDYQAAKDEPEPSKSTFYLFILTLSIGGLQLSWATELSNGSPYLQSLGMSKSLLALVWLAGPLGGVLVQPYVGIRSDNCRIRWGKRLPFMVGGAVATAISFLCLAWTRVIVHGFLGLFGADPGSRGVQVCSIIFAIIWVYVLDFSINTVQAAIRAFIVDNAPLHQQEDANAWASRITGVGNILGYLFGFLDLPKHFPWLGSTQMQVLCALASFAICGTVAISAAYIRERDPNLEGPPSRRNPGLIAFFRQTFHSALRMPAQIRKVCIAQFFNWLGWFGFLFYMTTYIGQIKLNPYFAANPDLTPDEIEDAWEDATRYATFALLTFAITSFVANMLLPLFVMPTYGTPPQSSEPSSQASVDGHADHFNNNGSPPSVFRRKLDGLLSNLQIPGLTLRRAWLLSHLAFAFLMCTTFFIQTPVAATVLTAFIGIPWALSLWAPFALISSEISKRDTEKRRIAIQHRHQPIQVQGDEEDQAGVILGLHNVAVSAPQILATLVSSVIFKLAQKPRGAPYDSSVGWVLRFGGLVALLAAYFTYRIGEEADLGGKRYERIGRVNGGRHGGEA